MVSLAGVYLTMIDDVNGKIEPVEISFVSQQYNSINSFEEQRLESGYPLGVSAIVMAQVRKVKCLV